MVGGVDFPVLLQRASPTLLMAGAAVLVMIGLLVILCCVAIMRCGLCSCLGLTLARDEDDDDDDDWLEDARQEEEEEYGHDDEPPQQILIEVRGKVVATRKTYSTRNCRSLKQLRHVVCKRCADYTRGAGERELTLEYLDESAGLAIMVVEEKQLPVVLSMPTLKATFSSKGGKSRSGNNGPRRGGGRRRGYERASLDEGGESDEDENVRQPSGCAVQ